MPANATLRDKGSRYLQSKWSVSPSDAERIHLIGWSGIDIMNSVRETGNTESEAHGAARRRATCPVGRSDIPARNTRCVEKRVRVRERVRHTKSCDRGGTQEAGRRGGEKRWMPVAQGDDVNAMARPIHRDEPWGD